MKCEMPVSTIPTFRWESNAFNKFYIEFSNSPSFPAAPVTLGDGTVLDTTAYYVGTSKYAWTPSATQWRGVKQLCTATGGTLYWRIRGTSTVDPGLGTLYSQTWHTYTIDGGHVRGSLHRRTGTWRHF